MKAIFSKILNVLVKGSLVWGALLVVGVVALTFQKEPSTIAAADGWQATDPQVVAWGSEAIVEGNDPHAGISGLSPVALANACGLGASSCFKCHNGKRAEAPSLDAEKSPWHAQHKSVNYSCAGCHGGNPRLQKKEIAHKGLIVNPVQSPEKSCASCHGGADLKKLTSSYHGLQSEAK